MRLAQVIASSLLFAASAATGFENLSSQQAFRCAVYNPDCYILDVRTAEEYRWVGHPGKNKAGEWSELADKVVNLPWEYVVNNKLVPNKLFNPTARYWFGRDKDQVVLVTMCRSGSRSKAAATALEALGFTVYNMEHGFEGDGDAFGYRTLNGWKNDGLPYNTVWEFYHPE